MSSSVVAMIDHAVLSPTQSHADLQKACELSRRLGVASICVRPSDVPAAVALLGNSSVVVSTVIGFPHGTTTTATKVAETNESCAAGAREVDMVVNLGRVFSRDFDYVERDIAAVVAAAQSHGAITKVIFESGLISDDDVKIALCQASERAGAAFVKTSTGFGYNKNDAGQLVATGATEHDIRLMRASCSPSVGVKASGGIRSLADAQRFVALGATRLGTSATETIVQGMTVTVDSY